MRSIWKGALSFGLVNIPIAMYTASRDKEVSFVLLHKKDLSEIRYARICKTEDKEVPWNEIVKGYEYEKGNYVILDEKDFEKANLKKTKTIEIMNFVDDDEIDSIYFVKPYFLEPEKNAENAYGLLREALIKSKKVGLAKYVLRNKEHIAVVKVHDNMLVLNELRYQNELLSSEDLRIPQEKNLKAKEIDIAIQLVNQLTIPFEPKEYKDTYAEELKQIIKQKSKGRPIHPKGEEPKMSKVQDIMSLLQASLEDKKSRKKTPKSLIKKQLNMPLKSYLAKRNFKNTPEPFESSKKHPDMMHFCVQKHHARHLHYDFRLEFRGVLLSWAVPKGPSMNPKEKRLAIKVEDHPLEYQYFQGVIPKGNYGAGTVEIWDHGSFILPDTDQRKEIEKKLQYVWKKVI